MHNQCFLVVQNKVGDIFAPSYIANLWLLWLAFETHAWLYNSKDQINRKDISNKNAKKEISKNYGMAKIPRNLNHCNFMRIVVYYNYLTSISHDTSSIQKQMLWQYEVWFSSSQACYWFTPNSLHSRVKSPWAKDKGSENHSLRIRFGLLAESTCISWKTRHWVKNMTPWQIMANI